MKKLKTRTIALWLTYLTALLFVIYVLWQNYNGMEVQPEVIYFVGTATVGETSALAYLRGKDKQHGASEVINDTIDSIQENLIDDEIETEGKGD
jgi:hypothetical protein